MKQLTIAIPCKASLQARFTMCLFQIVTQIHSRIGYMPLIRFLPGKSNIVHARSILLTEWYDSADETDLFLFLDSDQTFQIEDVLKIIQTKGDVVAGVYVNGAGYPTCFPLDPTRFQAGQDMRLLYAGCGFMLMRKPILHTIVKGIEQEGPSRFAVSRDGGPEASVIPFFQPKLLEVSEMTEDGTPKGDWLGEDYSFCWRVRQAGGTLTGFLSHTLGHEIPQVSFLPDGYFPSSQKTSLEKTIVYYCGQSPVKFSPTTKGLGGSEKAVVELSKAFATLGYTVKVYGTVWPGVYDGVEYLDFREFSAEAQYDTLILWRSFGVLLLPLVKANRILIDLHDIPNPEMYPLERLTQKNVKVCVKSVFHRKLLSHLPDSCFFIQPNGLEVERLLRWKPIQAKKDPLRFLWTSSYDRGLDVFLEEGWPKIRARFPSATLSVAYGMTLCPPEFQAKMIALFHTAKSQGVTELGRCDSETLTKERWKSSYHVYVTDFPEIDCLSIREAVMTDCIPICASHAAFQERPCLSVETSRSWDQVLQILERLESDSSAKEKVCLALRTQLTAQRLDESWETVAKAWKDLLD